MRPGFLNKGNTCYLNSVLQLILSTPCMINCHPSTGMLDSFIQRWKSCEQDIITPTEVLDHFQSAFPIGQQHDAHEFILSILCDYESHFRIIGRFCNKSVFKETIISLPVRPTIYQSISSYLEEDGCFYSCPPALLIHFKRYGSHHRSNIEVPCQLRIMSKAFRIKKKRFPSQLHTYNLVGAIIHSGDPSGLAGHYATVAVYNERRYLFNDHRVTELDDDVFQRFLARAYIVLYNKRHDIIMDSVVGSK